MKKQLLLVVCFFMVITTKGVQSEQKKGSLSCFLQDITGIALGFGKNIFTTDTLKVINATTPLYLASRMIDSHVHRNFYNERHHKNRYQFPSWWHHTTNWGIGAVIVSLSALSFHPYDEDIRNVAQVFTVVLPITWVGKNLLKKIQVDACLRPRHERYDRHKKYFGGCPSGHMMEAMYITTLFGMNFGPKWAIPLGIYSAAVFVNSINANRHFVSQLVAGAGLGVLFAFAADKVVHERTYDWMVGCVTHDGRPGISVSVSY